MNRMANGLFYLISCLLLGACGESTPLSDQLAVSYKATVNRAAEIVNARDFDRLGEVIAPNYVRHSQATPGLVIESIGDFRAFLEQDSATFPDSRMEWSKLVVEGDSVAFWGRYIGTQQGAMGPFPPTGKAMNLDIAGYHRMEEGKIAETWITWDNLAALTQLGHLPPAPETTSEQ